MRQFAKMACIGAAGLLTMGTAMQAAPVATGTINSIVGYGVNDLSAGTSQWVVYGSPSAPSITAKSTSNSPSSFGDIAGVGSSYVGNAQNGAFKYAHGAGYGTDPGATASTDSNIILAQDSNHNGPNFTAGLTFTHTLLAGSETMDVYVTQLSTDQGNDANFSASLSSGGTAYSVTGVLLPTSISTKGIWGKVHLTITGASAGDVLTFNAGFDTSGETTTANSRYWGIGIGAATATVVPEPTTLGLLSLGGLALLARRRRAVA